MGLHMVALAKLHLQLTSHSLRPALAGLACPLVFKFLMGFRIFRDEAVYASRLFFFRLSQIAFNRETPLANDARLERALRLIWGTLTATTARPLEDSEIEQETLHALSMIAL